MFKHAPKSFTRRAVATAAIAGAAVAVPVAMAASASADSVNWTAIANCESSGNWAANTGNGFSGGLQFTESTWLAYGGGQYAQYAYQASESQQIAVAEKVLAGQGIGAWPVCGAHAGDGTTYAGTNTGGSSSDDAASSSGSSSSSSSSSSGHHSSGSGSSSAHTSRHARPAHPASGSYTVRSGDTLSGIAAREGVSDWHTLYTANASTIGANPNLIFPGQVLDLG
jgi:nucleoid-associated protein YgaU